MEKVKIAFDLDGVIINKPPLIPKDWIEWLFRGWRKRKNGLCYRFPKSKSEIFVRKLSHFYLLRTPVKTNLKLVKKLSSDPKYDLFVVTSRYSFLKKETTILFKKWHLNNIFKEVFLNGQDEQPHLFKERILKELKPIIFVDDDKEIINYLEPKLKDIKFILAEKKGRIDFDKYFLEK
ncbi:hypothetical protein COT64_01045 [Candidatus Shapirobacteria bacterium CG09_land_8_20_14_0_10_39_12]|uniref:FCP1 homology domain-containing protein n=1 Tax=Candidatus Shapirobacteria bacterium CG09_land_8_20_14_0_10_39_12 TaxID=1974885 RepID=A0A2H0WQ32_9BACT|nr:MAG: hypothetical protein COT64_01045 [Candidatus Shapirobacteria bacterium CG09_land_8_20_14_0_10_39_12]